MCENKESAEFSRIAHYFREVEFYSDSSPSFMPEYFSANCYVSDAFWPANFLLRIAIRFHHLWPTFGVRYGIETIKGAQPAVCFAGFSVDDLIAVRDGLPAQNEHTTQYAITFPMRSVEQVGLAQVIRSGDLQTVLEEESGSKVVTAEDMLRNQFRCANVQLDLFSNHISQPEWRWPYAGDYKHAIAKIEEEGLEANSIPGLDLTEAHWSGVGVVVATQAEALRIQYDILSLIDRGLVAPSHFDHILVCKLLPASLSDLSDAETQQSIEDACYDFKSCMTISDYEAAATLQDFSARVAQLELLYPISAPKETGGCWVSFDDNTHPYVRALLKAGRIKVNKLGRYLGSLDELDAGRDLRERQMLVKYLCKQLQEAHGLSCSYYIVSNSWSPDDHPFYCGHPWRGLYRITDEPDGYEGEEDDDEDLEDEEDDGGDWDDDGEEDGG